MNFIFLLCFQGMLAVYLQKSCNSIWFIHWKYDNLGPVVQSIVSLTKSLVSDSLSLLVRIKSSVLIFFAEKMRGAFKLLTFFRQKMAVFVCIICLKF